jgi:hypothetical protein
VGNLAVDDPGVTLTLSDSPTRVMPYSNATTPKPTTTSAALTLRRIDRRFDIGVRRPIDLLHVRLLYRNLGIGILKV